jgi:hypothetical protein
VKRHTPCAGRFVPPTVWVLESGLVIRYRSFGKHRAATDPGRGLMALAVAPLTLLLLTMVSPWQVTVDAVALPRAAGPGPLGVPVGVAPPFALPPALTETADPVTAQVASLRAVPLPVSHPVVRATAPVVAAPVLPRVTTRPRRSAPIHLPVPSTKEPDHSWPSPSLSPSSTPSLPVEATGPHSSSGLPLRLRVSVPALPSLGLLP